MLRTATFICLISLLFGCSTLPGIQNPDTTQMVRVNENDRVQIKATLIPITPRLIADQRISKYTYHVVPADVLSILIWQHPEFNLYEARPGTSAPSMQGAAGQEGYLVNQDGKIYYPLIGYVHVAGKTVDQIRDELTIKLKRYIKDPQLNVRVSDFRGKKVYVLGEVMKPGFLPLNDQPLTITDALTLSGSLDPNAADPRHIYVIRGNFIRPNIYWLNAKSPESFLLAEHFSLQPGDVLYVSSATATRWNRVLNQLLPTLQTIWYTKSITHS